MSEQAANRNARLFRPARGCAAAVLLGFVLVVLFAGFLAARTTTQRNRGKPSPLRRQLSGFAMERDILFARTSMPAAWSIR